MEWQVWCKNIKYYFSLIWLFFFSPIHSISLLSSLPLSLSRNIVSVHVYSRSRFTIMEIDDFLYESVLVESKFASFNRIMQSTIVVQ